MSIAELVPRWEGLPDPSGAVLAGISIRRRAYRLRADATLGCSLEGILAARGLDGSEAFLRPNIARDMPSPWLLKGMEAASRRLANAFVDREKIVIFGDYDVDGAASSAVIGRWLQDMGHGASIYIPDRLTEGYGPSEAALARALADNPDLVIFVDCGTGAAALLDEIQCDVIVVDHHKPQGPLPSVFAVINPHREDDESGLGMLCAAGLAMLLVTAARKVLRDAGRPEGNLPLGHLFEIVALATVADVVPLVGPSRLFVSAGLNRMKKDPSTGVKALMAAAGVSEISAGKIGFALGPRVNAAGRVGSGSVDRDGAAGVRLLMAKDDREAMELAAYLDRLNRERQEVEKGCLAAAMEKAERAAADGARAILVQSTEWHPGIVGIVAGRLKERFEAPALVGATKDGIVKGSGRSVPGLDLGAIIIEAKHRGLLVSGGGHAMACGFGCEIEYWDAFCAFVNDRADWSPAPYAIDVSVDGCALDVASIVELEALEPLGQGMPSVKIAAAGLNVVSVRPIGTGHLKLECRAGDKDIEAIWWRASDDGVESTLADLAGRTVTAIGTPSINSWQGRDRISLTLADIILEDV